MKVQETNRGMILDVFVKPRSKEFKIMVEGDKIVAFCKEKPVKGKANKELVKELSRLFHRKVELVSGFTSKQKKLLIKDAEKSEVERVLSSE
jgi:uncharacterized protein (TIGR00251 family)